MRVDSEFPDWRGEGLCRHGLVETAGVGVLSEVLVVSTLFHELHLLFGLWAGVVFGGLEFEG